MHEPHEAPTATAGSGGARPLLAVAAVVVAATCAAYAGLLGHWFYSDDFAQLQNNRDLGWGGFLRFLVFADYGDRPWVYWRPGWMGLFQLVWAFAGATAWPYHLTCIVLHAAVAVAVTVIAQRATGNALLALAAGVLFAVMPSHCEAVAWVSAAFNVLPSALLLAVAGWASWHFAVTGGSRAGVVAVLLPLLSLTFKEAAYASPLVLLAAFGCARPLAAPIVWTRRWLAFAVLAGAIGWHYLARNTRTPLAGSADAVLLALVHNLAVFVRGVLPMLPANDYAAVAVTAVVGGVLFAMARPLARFFLAWSVIAWLPYVVMTSGERFAYFFHVPAVLFAVQLSADLARRWRWRRAPALLAGVWLLIAIAAALRLPAALDVHRRLGDECRRVWAFLDRDDLARRPQLIVDAVPACLENGFEAMLAVFGGVRPQIVPVQAVRVPPFLLYLNRAFDAMPMATPVLQLGSSDELRASDKAALVQGSVPLPILTLAGDYRIVADEAAARAALAEPGFDPAVRPLLYERPPCDLEPPGDYRIDNVAVDLRESTFDVDCARRTLLAIAFPVTVDLERNGRILVDGVPVPVLRANVLFHAICLPAGRHHVALRPALPGG